ncbi:DUF2093 domain-containing protein [Qipengyuania marisflavi]|uniref:DUF2093 domain-containing protein n=1 Tax=Qipengyuania marisflavi TaxID=2486356 RepID=A0A5S3P5M9_9SPHN|nr:DUF2093 domain-containing protein [Qipengyuania marisflavi]TMM48254.1 DUF2093 domain-containing protein [Qipengyuania marisflavi]
MLMNKSTGAGSEAKLHYGPNAFRVLRAGKYVLCAMSGVPVPLEELRYWSAEYQEPYASAQLAAERLAK